ncbi:MAG: 4'-phosphopantetheinyl transferase superfamily protein [Clostridia bacterium]|nr:4'-phosphopantetheinyl transferase superfamily protein [Clostridia bacterium]
MINLYLASCTKTTEHEVGTALSKHALNATFGQSAELLHGERGKPYFDIYGVYVSISHSNGLCLAAISDTEIGADIEYMQPKNERILRLAERYFTPDEAAYVRESPNERFYAVWCAKESYIKYTGEGFSRPLSSFSVLKSELCFSHFTIDGYAVCVCSRESADTPPVFIENAELE